MCEEPVRFKLWDGKLYLQPVDPTTMWNSQKGFVRTRRMNAANAMLKVLQRTPQDLLQVLHRHRNTSALLPGSLDVSVEAALEAMASVHDQLLKLRLTISMCNGDMSFPPKSVAMNPMSEGLGTFPRRGHILLPHFYPTRAGHAKAADDPHPCGS